MSSETWYCWQQDVLFIKVHVQTRAKMDAVTGIHADRLNIRIKAPPFNGKANKHLLAFLAKKLGISRSKLKITIGEHSRNKTIEVWGLDKQSMIFPDSIQ